MTSLDNDKPSSSPQSAAAANAEHGFFVVGLGASAGGIGALKSFFGRVRADSGLAYVVVLHLSPLYESSLAEILQNSTDLPVTQVTESVAVEHNHVYVIPPTRYLVIADGNLTPAEPQRTRGAHTSIDLFFRTLADGYGKDAIAIVLSGTGSDGALGLRRIKEHGGIAIAQDPNEAEYDSMPRAAIESETVDLILSVAEMPDKLRSLQMEEGQFRHAPGTRATVPGESGDQALRDVLTLLRLRTGHDFGQYKRPTLLRRIARRAQVHGLDDIPAYLVFLREHPEEIPALSRDLLITVTNFFRDREAFESLEREVIPKLFQDKGADDQVRVWVAGCATGEEAYSLAILLAEHAERLTDPPRLQVFATDIDEKAIAVARDCRYPPNIYLDVSQERLHRFFITEGPHYRVKKEVRELVLFAPHNLLQDPPFSGMDLVSCRNLLIYLNRDIQDRILSIFHFALRPGGFLFLGASDSADGKPLLFAPLNKKFRTYVRRAGPGTMQNAAILQPPAVLRGSVPVLSDSSADKAGSFGELHQKVVERLAPPSVLINDNDEIVHVSESAGRYLQFAGGEPSYNLLKAVHPDLKLALRAGLFAAKASHAGGAAHVQQVHVLLDGKSRLLRLSVRPVVESPKMAHGFLLVTFEELAEPAVGAARVPAAGGGADEARLLPVIGQLEDELQLTKDQLRLTIEQYETSAEELKASNEELQAINEELRSATEELETSKEELQSVNEELTTVNQEYKEKIEEVSRANSNLFNLMASTEIGTVFLDRSMRIKLYTPPAQELFNITEADVGRPLQHFTHKLDYPSIIEDAQAVLRNLHIIEREVGCAEDRWFLARLLPYRTLEDKIDGVVVSFLDITSRKQAADQLREQAAQLREQAQILELAQVHISDLDDRILFWNAGAERLYGYSKREALGQITYELLKTEFPCPLAEIRAHLLSEGEWEGEMTHATRTGDRLVIAARWVLYRNEQGEPYRILKATTDISRLKRAEAALRNSEGLSREILESLPQLVWTAAADGSWDYLSPQWLEYTGVPQGRQIGQGWLEQVHPDDREHVFQHWQTSVGLGEPFECECRIRGAGGGYGWFQARAVPLRDQSGVIVKWFGANTDIATRKKAEQALRDADRLKNEFLAMLSHELRNPLNPILSGVHVLRSLDLPDPRARETVDLIDRQVQQMTHLVNDLLDISRIAHGALSLDIHPVDMCAVVAQTVEDNRHLFEARQHELALSLPPQPAWLAGDPVRLMQVVANLLSNAAKYTPIGGHIRIGLAADAERITLQVGDDGVGIYPELLPIIFDAFTQGKRPFDRSEGGLGLGLTLVKRLVDLHGGTAAAESDGPGKGSVFTVSFARSPNHPETPEPGKPAKVPGPRKGGRILIVDDNTDSADSLAILLGLEGYDVRKAYDGATAIEAAADFRPQVCLLDIGLPGMDGFQLARRLSEMPPTKHSAFVAISGYYASELEGHPGRSCFSDYLLKPVDPDSLKALLAKLEWRD